MTIGSPALLPRLIFNWCTFSRQVTAWWSRGCAKKQPIRAREIGDLSLQDELYANQKVKKRKQIQFQLCF